MKNIELLTLSIATATLLVSTGCSSDDDSSPAASGPSAPSEISTPVELNASAARNALALVFNNHRIRPAGGLPPPPVDGNSSNSGTSVRDCDISGTETTTGAETQSDLGNGSWSSVETETTTFDNCIDNSDNLSYDTYTQKGSDSYSYESNYNADTDLTSSVNSYSDNYSAAYENNTTQLSETRTYSSYTKESTNIYKGDTRSGWLPRTKSTYTVNGEYERVDTDADGKAIDGYRNVYGAYSKVREYVYHDGSETSKKYTINGFRSYYDTNSTGDESLDRGHYFTNYVIHWYQPDSENTREEAVTVSGTIGDLCLGGSITIATSPVIHSNQYEYFDKDGSASGDWSFSSSVLPYSGKQSISGSNSATITYDYNGTKQTSASVTIGDDTQVYGTWAELLADSTCGAP